MWSRGPLYAQASEATTDNAENTNVAIDSKGNFVVVWQEGGDIKFRRFARNGDTFDASPRNWLAESTSEISVTYDRPSIVMTSDGGFIIAYERILTSTTGTTYGIGFTKFNAAGTAIVASDLSSSFTGRDLGNPSRPTIAIDNTDQFTIVWQETDNNGRSRVLFDIFSAAGESSPGSFIATELEAHAPNPDVAVNPVSGEIAIAYESFNGSNVDVLRKIFRSDGSLLLDAERVHSSATGEQTSPSVAFNASGDVFYAWIDFSIINEYFVKGLYTSVMYGSENIYDPSSALFPTEIAAYHLPEVSGVNVDPEIATSHRRDTIILVWKTDDAIGKIIIQRKINLAAYAGDGTGNDHDLAPFTKWSLSSAEVAMNAEGDYVFVYAGNLHDSPSSPLNAYAAPRRFQPFDSIGVFNEGAWTLDLDFDNQLGFGDAKFEFGLAGDKPITGDWDGDGFANIGVYRNGTFYLDYNGDFHFDEQDLAFNYGLAGDKPVAGDWNGDGRDETGVFRDGNWYIDANGNHSFESESDLHFVMGLAGDTPIVMDIINDGQPMWGVHRDVHWFFDWNRNRQWDGDAIDVRTTYGLPGDVPIGGNWLSPTAARRIGTDEPAVFRNGEWLFRIHDSDYVDFTTNFGSAGDQPIAGNWSRFALQTSSSLVRRDEIGVFREGTLVLDANGNQSFDKFDSVSHFDPSAGIPIVGDFDGNGFDEVGLFHNGIWMIDLNGNGRLEGDNDLVFGFGQSDDVPVVGDWDGDGRDEVGVFRKGRWILDSNHNYSFDSSDESFDFGLDGYKPVAGDWNGDGRDEIGTFYEGRWTLDYNGNRVADLSDRAFVYGTAGDNPIVGDWTGDGFTDVGVMRHGTWYLDRNGDGSFDQLDWIFAYGLTDDLPLAGRWPISL